MYNYVSAKLRSFDPELVLRNPGSAIEGTSDSGKAQNLGSFKLLTLNVLGLEDLKRSPYTTRTRQQGDGYCSEDMVALGITSMD